MVFGFFLSLMCVICPSLSFAVPDCGRKDVLPPIESLPLELSQQYLNASYDVLFSKIVSEDDKLYFEALKAIATGDLSLAQNKLAMLRQLNPTYEYGLIQQGFICLWQANPKMAMDFFNEALKLCPCSEFALKGAFSCAKAFERCESYRDAEKTYDRLLVCEPASFAYLFGRAKVRSHMGKWHDAERDLLICREMGPTDSDVTIALGNLYFWQGRYEEAKALYQLCQERVEALEGLVKVAKVQGDHKSEIGYLEKMEKSWPANAFMLKERARDYIEQRKFHSAMPYYSKLLMNHPSDAALNREVMDAKENVDPSLHYVLSYVEAKENDPSLKKPVVRDYYFNSDAEIFIPIYDRLRVDIKAFYGFQEEKNILPTNPGINYQVPYTGGAAAVHALIAQHWRLDISAALKSAFSKGTMVYPFKRTTRFEPAAYGVYLSEQHYLSLGGNVESYVIKNFRTYHSQLMAMRTIEALYRYTAPIFCRPELEVRGAITYFQGPPTSRRDVEEGTLRFFVPYMKEHVKLFYTFQHGHFTRLSQNYNSFSEQWRNTFGAILLYQDSKRRADLDLTYWYRIQGTKNLYMPIGDFVYIAPWQLLHCNQVELTYRMWLRQLFKAEIMGGYYRDTLPYRAWKVHALLSWLF